MNRLSEKKKKVQRQLSDYHLVSDAESVNVGPWTVFERVGRRAHQDLLGGVSVVIRPRQQQIPVTNAQSLGLSAHSFKPVGPPHGVQISFLDEVSDVIETGKRCVLEEDKRERFGEDLATLLLVAGIGRNTWIMGADATVALAFAKLLYSAFPITPLLNAAGF